MAGSNQPVRISPRRCAPGRARARLERALLRSLVAALFISGLGTIAFGEDESTPPARKPRQPPVRVSSERSPVPNARRVVQAGARRDDSENPRKVKFYDN